MTALPSDIEQVALSGWCLYPASQRSKAACIRSPGAAASRDLNQLEAWAQEFPHCNWRMVCGPSGLWALDLDVPSADHAADGVAALAAMVRFHGPIAPRPMTRSGGGGLGLFFRYRGEPITGNTGWPMPGIGPRRGMLSVTVPPSIHIRTRRPYIWLAAPWEIPPPDAPDWLLKAVAPPHVANSPYAPSTENAAATRRSRYAEAALRHAVGRVADAPQGQRNDNLNKETFGLMRFVRSGHLSVREVAECMAVAAHHAGLSASEVQATLRSALRFGIDL